MNNKESKTVFTAIVGKPNVGKSSLLNRLMGEKIAIVTQKPQTTRTRITGVLTEDNIQYVFIDTPGFHKPKTRLSDSMLSAVGKSIKDVDVILWLVEPFGRLTEAERTLLESIKTQKNSKVILVINKIDVLKSKDVVADRIAELTGLFAFDAIVPISVTENDGIDILKAEISRYAIVSQHFFPDDTLTDQPERAIVSEILREKLLLNLREEIPHGTAVVIETMRERADRPIMDIDATIICEKASHKGMIIGKGGEALKKIASAARADMEIFLDCKVNLKCWVKIKEDWRNSDVLIENFGLTDK